MRHVFTIALVASAMTLLSGCNTHKAPEKSSLAAEQAKNLATFDDLDFNVYSGQKWNEFGRSHAEDIVVHYPDGSTTKGLAAHLDRLRPQFAFAPDTKIPVHPIKLADKNYTVVQGIMEGTFSKPMEIGPGKFIQPTGKRYKLAMVTIGRWERRDERRMAVLG